MNRVYSLNGSDAEDVGCALRADVGFLIGYNIGYGFYDRVMEYMRDQKILI